MDMNTPDWTFWRNMPEVALWQACALSLNINPDSLRNDPYACVAGAGGSRIFLAESFPDDATKFTFGQRLRILRANLPNKDLFTSCAGNIGLPDDNSKVRIFEFASWAVGIGWTGMPSELVELAKQGGTSSSGVTLSKNAARDNKPSINDWRSNARNFGQKYSKSHRSLNLEKIADKVHAEMVSRHKSGEPGMTGRSDKVPSAASIKRHALTGIKTGQ